MIPPMGYFKDINTNKVEIAKEIADNEVLSVGA